VIALEIETHTATLAPNTAFLVIVFVGIAVALVASVFWLAALVGALRTSDEKWAAIGQSKLVWVVVIVFLHVLGALLYFVIPRPALRRA